MRIYEIAIVRQNLEGEDWKVLVLEANVMAGQGPAGVVGIEMVGKWQGSPYQWIVNAETSSLSADAMLKTRGRTGVIRTYTLM